MHVSSSQAQLLVGQSTCRHIEEEDPPKSEPNFCQDLMWSPDTRDFRLDLSFRASGAKEEEKLEPSSVRVTSGVRVHYPPGAFSGINGRQQCNHACNVTISTSWIIKTTSTENGDDGGDAVFQRRAICHSEPKGGGGGGPGQPKNNNNPSECDFERIRNCVRRLEASGWYYGKLSWLEATELLKSKATGTFLVRDSLDPVHLFALSVKTECGPTSIRINYSNGYFKLDCEDLIASRMPLFSCVTQLVEYYIRMSDPDRLTPGFVWLDESGRRDRTILINQPLYHRVRPLQHLCRLAVNERIPLHRIPELGLPKALQSFVTDYPFSR